MFIRKIVAAVDSMKGSLSSLEAGIAVSEGVKQALPSARVSVVAVADGGEGTVDAVLRSAGGERVSVSVENPAGVTVRATYGICARTAVIEMAAASGLPLIAPGERNPMEASSFGTGQLIADALRRGCREFLIGLGGSATNDGGLGMLEALGFRFLDSHGNPAGRGGAAAGRVAKIDASAATPELRAARFRVACDVTNPLTGPQGASRVFGPQKGADPEMACRLDAALLNFAEASRRFTGHDFSAHPGAGAAGGMGFAFLEFLGGELVPGIDMVLDAAGFDRELTDADLVITGEGRLDRQTCMGKAPGGVLRRAMKQGVPVVAIGGSVDPEAVGALTDAGFAGLFPIVSGPMDLTEAMKPQTAARGIRQTVCQIVNLLKITR